jgi:hypothetical protein
MESVLNEFESKNPDKVEHILEKSGNYYDKFGMFD